MPASMRDQKATEKNDKLSYDNPNVTENKVVNTSKKVIY
jgi:hypothetical protein